VGAKTTWIGQVGVFPPKGGGVLWDDCEGAKPRQSKSGGVRYVGGQNTLWIKKQQGGGGSRHCQKTTEDAGATGHEGKQEGGNYELGGKRSDSPLATKMATLLLASPKARVRKQSDPNAKG